MESRLRSWVLRLTGSLYNLPIKEIMISFLISTLLLLKDDVTFLYLWRIWHLILASADVVEDSSEGAVVQRKGRFKVTSADLSPKVHMNS